MKNALIISILSLLAVMPATAEATLIDCVQMSRHICKADKGCSDLQDKAPNQWSFRIGGSPNNTATVQRCSGGECSNPFTVQYSYAWNTYAMYDPVSNEVFHIHLNGKRFVHINAAVLPDEVWGTTEFGYCNSTN